MRAVRLEVAQGRGEYSEVARWAVTAQQVEGGPDGGATLFCIEGGDYSAAEAARRVGSVAYTLLGELRKGKDKTQPVKSAKFRIVIIGDRDKELDEVGRTLRAEGAPLPNGAAKGGHMTELTLHAMLRDSQRRDAERERQFIAMIEGVRSVHEGQGRMYGELIGHIKDAYESSSKAAIEALQAFVEVKIREMVVSQREADVEAQGIMDPQMAEWFREQLGPVIQEIPTLLKHLPDLIDMFRSKS